MRWNASFEFKVIAFSWLGRPSSEKVLIDSATWCCGGAQRNWAEALGGIQTSDWWVWGCVWAYLKVKKFAVSSVDDVGGGVRVSYIDEIHLKKERERERLARINTAVTCWCDTIEMHMSRNLQPFNTFTSLKNVPKDLSLRICKLTHRHTHRLTLCRFNKKLNRYSVRTSVWYQGFAQFIPDLPFSTVSSLPGHSSERLISPPLRNTNNHQPRP